MLNAKTVNEMDRNAVNNMKKTICIIIVQYGKTDTELRKQHKKQLVQFQQHYQYKQVIMCLSR